MTARRLWALGAVGLFACAVVLAIAVAVSRFPRGLSVLVVIALALAAAWYGVRRRGTARWIGIAASAVLLIGAVVIVIVEGEVLADVLVIAAIVGSLECARRAFAAHVQLPRATRPRHPVLLYNPRSGDGKAARFHLADEAERRGIEALELEPGNDLEVLVRDAVARGADALAMAGGDGSQAIVAAIASELNLPYSCIPSGTRNHFALDLGVDRNDVVGALDALVDGGERRVDLARVNGKVFVNNVSLGLYAEAVQRPGYREAKMHTLLATVPDMLGPNANPPDLHWSGPDGDQKGVAILVSNNPYRLGRALHSGTRPRLDGGRLGIAVLGPFGARRRGGERVSLTKQEWSEETFEVSSGTPVPAGIDGEAVVLDPPLRFETVPGALRVLIAPQHPGASPSAQMPESGPEAIMALVRIAFGRTHPAMGAEAPAAT
jgi:diacylglycerol kinase family enzyme